MTPRTRRHARRHPRHLLVALLPALGLAVAACGPAGEPRDLSGQVVAQRPQPAGVGGAPPEEDGEVADDDCDATASLEPDGADIPDGSTMAEIRDRGHLVAGVDQNTFLFGFHNPATGQLEGFDIDIAREVAGAIFGDRDRVRFRTITSAERIPALREGDVDIVVRTMTVNCARREHVEFSSVYFEAGQRVLVRAASGVDSLDDLAGQRVCAAEGSTSLRNIAEAAPEPVSVPNWSDCLVMLQQRQVEAVSTDDTILAGMAEQDPTTEVVGEPFTEEPYAIGIPPGDEDMVRYVNAVLEDVREDRWDELYDRWIEPVLGGASPPDARYR
ncbi:glutamate ABC transporter substrate-binding protein [Haloechinothrix sp. YIM 98757]|uniref:Glutamate ABC transporter substrate-binding protein n=1 Tax=Haloechinothrix aidingensis TaxID=2752311 RepID=A0A838A4F3_9PSEU|nr:glutamate ABC transporter substrate-binding protein [Haloechinothrix aidingensis]MBA0124490.1 glutamate ABC transporter substrate-binding protein [Haloechinothrix aidingensis]